jgi:hypothetical protein
MWIELGGMWVQSAHVVAVKAAGKRTSVWTTGASAVDGAFLIDEDVDTVMEALRAIQAEEFASGLIAEMEEQQS